MVRRWRIAFAVTIACVLAAAGIFGLLHHSEDHSLCLGALIVSAPTAPTEEEAVAAYVKGRGGRAEDWHRTKNGWKPRHAEDGTQVGAESLSAEGGNGTWKVTGACAATKA